MMTIEERLKMYREKKNFVYDISMAFIKNPKGHSVDGVVYEVWFQENENGTYFSEWIIVKYDGGGWAPRIVSGNSNSANFKNIADLIDGGYYAEKTSYESLPLKGYKKLDLTKMAGLYEEK